MKDLTPEHMRCEWGGCPSVHELDDGSLLIVGRRATMAGAIEHIPVGEDEFPVIIDRALLANVHAEAITSLQGELGRLRVERANLMAQWADFPMKDGGLSIDTASAAGRLRELAEWSDDERPVLLDIAEMLDAAGPTVQALRAEVGRLRETLEDIAHQTICDEVPCPEDVDWKLAYELLVEDARDALSQHPGEGEAQNDTR